MSQSTPLSAFAKRRRLNHGAGSLPDQSAASEPQNNVVLLNHAHQIVQDAKSHVESRQISENESDDSESSQEHATNSFDALVKASAVHFSGTREVEQLNERCLKVRLSKGQKCVFVGIASIWVKKGVVSVYGAKLGESTDTHMIFAPSSHPLSPIIAMTTLVEFHLNSVQGSGAFPQFYKRDIWTHGKQKGAVDMSFSVFGHSTQQDTGLLRKIPEIDLEPMKNFLAQLTSQRPVFSNGHSDIQSGRPRILICGRYASTNAIFTRGLINFLLTSKSREHADYSQGITILDYDSDVPEYGATGTVSLIQTTKPVLGPSFTHLISSGDESIQIKRMHFVGIWDHDDSAEGIPVPLKSLLECERSNRTESRKFPLLIRGWHLMEAIHPNRMSDLAKYLALTHVICFDNDASSQQSAGGSKLAEKADCAFVRIPVPRMHSDSTIEEHQMQIQSYLHLADGGMKDTYWDRSPILGGERRELSFSYIGDGKALFLSFVHIAGGALQPDDILETLEGAIVAIVIAAKTKLDPARSDAKATSAITIPRVLDIDIASLECIGLGVVCKVDREHGRLGLVTPVPEGSFLQHARSGQGIGLAMEKPNLGGKFDREWLHKEAIM